MLRIIIPILLIFIAVMSAMAEEEAITIEEVVVTATRYEEGISSVPAYITVISKEDINNSTAQNIPDMLRTEAGVLVNDITGNRREVTVDIRGFGETGAFNTLVLVDGRRINEADISGTDWTLIPLERVERIEIIRGGSGAVLYGDNASGGVINIITKKGEDFETGAAIAYGSYDTYKGNAYISGSTEDLSYSLNGTFYSSDGYRDNSKTEAKDVGVNMDYFLSNHLKLNLSGGYHHDDIGMPGSLRESNFAAGASREETFFPMDFEEKKDYYIKAGSEFFFLDDSFARIDISYRNRDRDSFIGGSWGESLMAFEIKTLSISPQIYIKSRHENIVNSLTAGFDYIRAEEDVLNDVIFFGFPSSKKFDFEKKNYGYYIHDEINVMDRLTLSGGFRYERAKFSFNPSTTDSVTLEENVFTAGLNYNFYKESYLYLSFAESFRNPLFDEFFDYFTNTVNTSLTDQSSENYELGVRHYFNEKIYAHANVFIMETEDEIFFNSPVFMNDNLDGETDRKGFELSFSAGLVEWLTVNGTYTYTDASIEGGMFDGKDFPNVPDHKASLETVFYPVEGLMIAINGVYVGERPFISDFTNSFDEQEDYTVINGKVEYKKQNVTIFLDVNNLTDEEYSEYGVIAVFPTEKAFYPSPKRNFLAGLSVEF